MGVSIEGRVVLITGASSGIGMACARLLAAEGCRLILAARRADRLEALAGELAAAHGTTTLVIPLDVRTRAKVEAAVAGLPAEWVGVDILVNNAGLSRGLDPIDGGDPDDWEEMIDTNVKGLLWVTRAVVPGMIARGRGDVVNIGSIAGEEVYPKGNVYCATKFAVRAISKGMRLDLVETPLRVIEVAPGMVETDFSLVRFHGDRERAARTYRTFPPLRPEDVAEAVVWCVTRPPHVNVSRMLVMPTAQASVGVHRAPKP
jgi:3-hydroxy acid dehydrogenase/malonic semialdehyde reductase